MSHLIKIIQILVILGAVSQLLEPNFGFNWGVAEESRNNMMLLGVYALALISVIQFVILGIKRKRGEIPTPKETPATKKVEQKASSSPKILSLNKKAFLVLVVLAVIGAYAQGATDNANQIGSPLSNYIGAFLGYYLVFVIAYRISRGEWGGNDQDNKRKIIIGLAVTLVILAISLANNFGLF